MDEILDEDRDLLIKYVDSIDDAKYYITNFRWQNDKYSLAKKNIVPNLKKEVFSIDMSGMKILAVYSIRYM